MYRRGFGRAAPINVGEEFDVKIDNVGEKGDGIARVQGFVIFVPGVKAGDEVRIRITRISRRFGFAEVVGNEKAKEAEEPETEVEEATEKETEQPEQPEQPVDTEDFGEE